MILISSLLNTIPPSLRDLLEFVFSNYGDYSRKNEALMKTYLIAISLFGTAIITTAIAPSIAYAI